MDIRPSRRMLFPILGALVIFSLAVSPSFAASHKAHRESAQDPDIQRLAPIPDSTQPSSSGVKQNAATQTQSTTSASAATATTLGPNLIQNPSVETAGSNGLPAHWSKGGYGTNTRTLTYPATGSGGSGTKAISLTVSNYSNGDAKWFPDDVAVTAGNTYQFSDGVKSTATSIVDIRFTLSDGSFVYKDIGTYPSSASFTTVSAQFVAPAGAVSVTIFHLLNTNGTLTTDDYSLQQVTQSAQNYVQNGDFELAGANGLPAHWTKGGYGSSTRVLTYPIPGQTGNGAQVTVSNYSSGDAKWVFDPISPPPGTYQYTDSYIGTVPSILTAQFQRSDGTYFYTDLKTLPAASSWTSSSAFFTMPTDAVNVQIFHLINQNGSLNLDNVAVTAVSSTSKGIFATGGVTFRFDDGLASQYNNAAPILDNVGFKGTFYIISQQTADTGYSGSMSVAQVQNLASRGDEIGAHTRTHPHLNTLTSQQQQDEIAGSRQDILGWNVGPVLSFSYPYGEYSTTTIQIVKNAGFQSAVATIGGYVTQNSDPYQLEYQEPHNDTTLAEMEGWIDNAAATHTWVILALHDVDNSGTLYAITPTMFQNLVNYVKQKGIPVVTVSQGMQSF